MAQRISVYIEDGTYRKLGDLKRVLESGVLGEMSVSKVVNYAILRAWQAEFVEALDPSLWSDELKATIAKYAPAGGGNGGGEQ